MFIQRLLTPSFIVDRKSVVDLNWTDMFSMLSDLFTQMGSLHGLIGNVASLELVNVIRELIFFNSGTLQTQNEERELEINMDLRIFYLFNFLLKEVDLKKNVYFVTSEFKICSACCLFTFCLE